MLALRGTAAEQISQPETAMSRFGCASVKGLKHSSSSPPARPTAQAVMRVIGRERPPFRYQTNPLYTPLTALRQADDTGQLSVQTFSRLLFRHGAVFRASLAALRCLTCSCCRAAHSDA